MPNEADLVLPALTIEAEGYSLRPGPHYLGLCLGLENLALSQYVVFNFNSMCKLGDVYLGINEYGIFVIDSGDTDYESAIESFVELPLTDFGIAHQKRLRSVYIGYESDGDLELEVENDEGNARTYMLKPTAGSNQVQKGARVTIGRNGKGRYWSFKISNIQGCDFSLDQISVIPIILARKPSGT